MNSRAMHVLSPINMTGQSTQCDSKSAWHCSPSIQAARFQADEDTVMDYWGYEGKLEILKRTEVVRDIRRN